MKKVSKMAISLVLVMAILLNYFWPLTKVIAEDHGTGDYYITLNIANELGFDIESFTINGENWTGQGDKYYVNYVQENERPWHIEIIVRGTQATGDKVPRLQYGGNWNDYFSAGRFVENDGSYKFILDIGKPDFLASTNENVNEHFVGLEIVEEEQQPDPNQNNNNQDPNQNNNNQDPNQNNEPIGPNFDGKAYLIWSCKSGGICMYHFDNIPNYDDGNSTFYKASEIVDERTGESFNVDAEYRGWATDDRFDDWVSAYKTYKNISTIDWSKVNPEDMLGDPIDMREWEDKAIKAGACTRNNTPQDEFEACVDQYVASQGTTWASRVQLQPVGEPDANNAYVSYGDRNFKVVVYNDKYRGVSIGDLSELEYYPDYMTNPFIRQDQFDISGTTKDKPTAIDTVLLEKVVRIKAINDVNDFTITKIEALDVPDDAVSITKVDGEWRLEFSSNFFDKVVFKATGSDGKDYYFQVKRTTIDGWIKNDQNKPVINADFWFDKERSYKDFDLTAKIYYKDGTTKKVKLEATKGIDDGLGNITNAYEVNDGKGLKKSTFQYNLSDGEDKKIKTIYFNAEYKGSTSSKYAGAYVGSGEGVKANLYEGDE